ncbi:TIM barrel protein [Actinopolymorpha sp. B11F2]|uniref:TIM barrel protein n=1 Tax=Actinopolymorpha sp. B11F2 TaxID=3160862 RepID=UPI0032E4D372
MDHGPLTGRVAGAPISWGVCEAPGWGVELPPSEVLAQMAALGLAATELGPTGYLGPDAASVRRTLATHGLGLVGGFVPVTLHLAAEVDLAPTVAAMRTLAEAGAEVAVLAADGGPTGYDRKVSLDDAEWAHLLHNLDRVRAEAAALGLRACLHPHVGTAIESRDAVIRLLRDSDVGICLDTGHLAIGGMDPTELVASAAERITHVHLKDVRLGTAKAVAEGSVSFLDGVRTGLFAPLGQGDLDIGGVVAGLERAGFTGWYVLEQDAALSGPLGEREEGPEADVRRSMEFLWGTVVPALDGADHGGPDGA